MSSTSLLKLFGLGTPVRSPLDVHPQDDGERHLGLENFGNTCYCNSVLQALYYCKPFRDCVIQFPQAALAKSPLLRNGTGPFNKSLPSADAQPEPSMNDTLFATLKDLFLEISTHRKKSTFVAPVNFINKVKKENELFRSSMHQDAHEFLNFLLNTIAEDVETFQKRQSSDSPVTSTDSDTSSAASGPHSSWVHQLFEGVFSNETKCLTCETVTSRDESFMDLSIDVEMNSSVTSCLRQFSASETLCHKNKYFCDECSGLQEAERRMKIKKLPNILALHLKRFKYQEQLQKYIKLTYRVVFPFELRLFNTCDDTDDADRLYELWACVIHIGSGPHHGHYVTIIKSNGQWLLFDDDEVTNIQEEDIQKYFSDLPGSGSGYVLFYQAINMEPIRMQDQETAVEHLPANAMPTLNGHHHDSTSMHHHFNPHHLGNKRDFAPPPAQPVSLPQHHHHHLADNLPIPAQSIHATESFSNTNGRSTTSSGRARHWNIGIKKKR
ncbi:cysteine proteinase [Hesseltinella vesiculosa]|uniref:ubiquitinyl hydrolase 1 n=1 Tax=Hesseltinella vesiculosa TaxID=101127 RepID=A0A1X2GB91_9FUNG|nr:cysteine proteinase [Hesseltinella vesiculosa]